METPLQNPSKKKMGVGKKLLIGAAVITGLGILGNMGEDSKESNTANASTENVSPEGSSESTPKMATVGEAIRTDYFDITLHKYSLNDYIDTGNEFADLAPQNGSKYLVITATWKNTDKESRMLEEGSVFINVDGTEYEFDKSETIMLEGWGAMLQQINPLTTFSTRLVYKIPSGVKGPIYWEPGRNSDNTRFLLGTI